MPGGLPTIETLIADGVDPVHAAYVFIQNLSSHFAERASGLPELAKYAKVVADAEDRYLPSGPPMSPLTVSYFTCWAFYDLRLNSDGETLGQCQLDLNDILMMQPDQVDVLRKLSDSRMGIYEHLEAADGLVRLRELITGDEFLCLCTAGYQGTVGELWYVRRLPPLIPELASYHILFTTPYILMESTLEDWTQYLRRAIANTDGSDDSQRLHQLLKFGTSTHHWNEFVCDAFHHHQRDAIFLSGIPDLRATLPHG